MLEYWGFEEAQLLTDIPPFERSLLVASSLLLRRNVNTFDSEPREHQKDLAVNKPRTLPEGFSILVEGRRPSAHRTAEPFP